MILSPPNLVGQDKEKMVCWAAATESYLAARPTRRNYTCDQIVEGMRQEGVLDRKGGLTKTNGQYLWELYYGLRPIREKASEFSWEKSLARLKMEMRPMIIGLDEGGSVGHIAVMFGADEGNGDPYIAVMDPWYSEHHRKWKISELNGKMGNITTWMAKMPLLV